MEPAVRAGLAAGVCLESSRADRHLALQRPNANSLGSECHAANMADDIEAELIAAGKELDKVRHSTADIMCAADMLPG